MQNTTKIFKYTLDIFHGKYETLALSCLLIWDKEEQDRTMASEEVSKEHFFLLKNQRIFTFFSALSDDSCM